MKRAILFTIIVAPIVYLLTFGLMRNPQDLPSVLIGKPAPTFVLQTLDGKKVTLESFKGSSVILNFWATWCGPCAYEHPVLKEARDRYEKEGVKFFGVVYQDTPENAKAFIKEMGEPFMVLLDPESKAAIDYGVGGVPETFFIDPQGIIRAKSMGVLTLDFIQKQIKEFKKNGN